MKEELEDLLVWAYEDEDQDWEYEKYIKWQPLALSIID